MTDDRKPDTSEDPRRQATTGQGLPETAPDDAAPAEGAAPGPGGDHEKTDDAPDTRGGQDRKPGSATGNPRAAGA
jgi:hypothetical protein